MLGGEGRAKKKINELVSERPWEICDSYPPRLSLARKSRSDIRVKTPATAGKYTEFTSLLQVKGGAIAAALTF